ncbi:SHOCT domain-containing protein [Natrinema sp. 1APR25-10V2]|uniref:SHOCT domain-containing protein n=1 Tax=Natrinema sp. 1APR25-10V2 TaxID=2951081 RepID=UPI00287699B8|nr:SHOCT domain-containing protein [Natrinema sp. 1APR25-10V2]MDS0476495.1 SHOCT domain-containing protein [Natrinema sp. 1APR25-10V2]
MGRLSSVLLRAVGVLVLTLVALSVVATIVGIALSVVAAVLSVVVTLIVFAVFALALVGLGSLLRHDSSAETETDGPPRSETRADAEARLRSRYVAGELDDVEFERELERVLRADEGPGRRRSDRVAAREPATDRRRYRDR